MNVMGAGVTTFKGSLWVNIGLFSGLKELAYYVLTRYVSEFLTRAVLFHISGVRKRYHHIMLVNMIHLPGGRCPVSPPWSRQSFCRDVSISRWISFIGDL